MRNTGLSSSGVPCWVRPWFQVAAIYGGAALVVALASLSTDSLLRLTQLAFIGVAGAFQLLFWIIALDPLRYRVLMLVAVAEKVAFGLPALTLARTVHGGSAIAALAIIDLLLAIGFLRAWRSVPSR